MSWYEAVQAFADAVEAVKSPELNQLLAKVRVEGAKLAEENARFREELLRLREAARLRGTMIFRENVYWQVEGDKTQGPFCPKCWPADSKAVRMVDLPSNDWSCPVCDTYIVKPGGGGHQPEDFDSPLEPIR